MKRSRSSPGSTANTRRTKKQSPCAATNNTTLPFRGVRNDTSKYLPLDPKVNEIRYIAIDPGKGNAPLSGFLGYLDLRGSQTHTLPVAYQAVSYCWGEIEDTVALTLRCARTKKATARSAQDAWIAQQYQITRNLDALLRALRLEDAHRTLWVDAICIAQDDAVEKTHQVGSMGLLYSLASEVLVWLGEADVYSNIFIEAHKVFASSVPEVSLVERYLSLDNNTTSEGRRIVEWDFGMLWFEDVLKNEKLLQLIFDLYAVDYFDGDPSRFLPGFLHEIFKNKPVPLGLLDLFVTCADRCFSRPWFRRIWVIQEVVMAPLDLNGTRKVTVFSGQSQLQWNELVVFALLLKTTARTRPCHELDFFCNSWLVMSGPSPDGATSAKFSIEDCLLKTVTFQSSDPRDRLFALLQLGSNTSNIFRLEPLLHADYTRPLTLVMSNYRRWQILRSGDVPSAKDKYRNDDYYGSVHSSREHIRIRDKQPSLPCHSADPISAASLPECDHHQSSKEEALTVIGDTIHEDVTNRIYPIPRVTARVDRTTVSGSEPPGIVAGPLDYLLTADTTRNDPLLHGAPSWVTNIFIPDMNVQDGFSANYGVYNASGKESAITRPTDSALLLSLKGVHIARIGSALIPQPLGDETSASPSYYMIIRPGRQPFMTSKRESSDLPTMYKESLARVESQARLSAAHRKAKVGGKFQGMLPHLEDRELRSRSIAFTTGRPPTERRRLYWTTQGDLVLASEEVNVGDLVVILFGGRVPFILRQDRKLGHSILGPCFFYQDKWMKGEKLLEEPVAEEFFELI